MKRVMSVFMCLVGAQSAYAACPSGWSEVPMENFIVSNTSSCPDGMISYYHVSDQCNANIY